MTPFQYLNKFGRAEADATAKRAKLSPAYFNQVCYGHRHASYAAAKKLVKAQHKDGRMTILSILVQPHRKKGTSVKSFERKLAAAVAEARA